MWYNSMRNSGGMYKCSRVGFGACTFAKPPKMYEQKQGGNYEKKI